MLRELPALHRLCIYTAVAAISSGLQPDEIAAIAAPLVDERACGGLPTY